MMIKERSFEALFGKFVGTKYNNDKSFCAANYSLFAGGKRLRFLLSQKTAEYYNNTCELSDRLCVAVELIHNYSLIHDDLPCMDNSMLRRGKPTCHAIYGDSFATLAGDSLLNLSAEILFNAQINQSYIDACGYIFEKSGSLGMINGQSLDMQNDVKDLQQYEYLSLQKTAMMFSAAVVSQAIFANADKKQVDAWKKYCIYYGTAYQFADDIADGDEDGNKVSILKFCTLKQAKQLVYDYCTKADKELKKLSMCSEFHQKLIDNLIESVK